ncbi:MAG: formylglycine-generating enzyme family protein [Chloroflexales bacterium]|nr:formylglycine-generating enzyme family protein [Chloroflexales bacterium]
MTFALPTFITIPTTTFLMGTDDVDLSTLAKNYGGTRESYREESPQHRVTVASFAIASTTVTVALYATYIAHGGVAPSSWQAQSASPSKPVVNITWSMANAFCVWLSEYTTDNFSLPDEAQWECAARGNDGRQFPWGEVWDDTHAAVRGSCTQLMPVASYPNGVSPWGCFDMAGNVWEWTTSLDQRYPYDARDGRNDMQAIGRRIIRGGCYVNPHGYARCACRFRMDPLLTNPFLGFRITKNPS